MKTKSQMTYILLEKGEEDKSLYLDILKVMRDLKIPSFSDAVKSYPALMELKQCLYDELHNQEITDIGVE